MGREGYNFREIRMVYADNVTHCWVLLEAWGDCPIGVNGWHYKAFPPAISGEEIHRLSVECINRLSVECIKWPQAIPIPWGNELTRLHNRDEELEKGNERRVISPSPR